MCFFMSKVSHFAKRLVLETYCLDLMDAFKIIMNVRIAFCKTIELIETFEK